MGSGWQVIKDLSREQRLGPGGRQCEKRHAQYIRRGRVLTLIQMAADSVIGGTRSHGGHRDVGLPLADAVRCPAHKRIAGWVCSALALALAKVAVPVRRSAVRKRFHIVAAAVN